MKRLTFWMLVISLLLVSCGGKEVHSLIPPPPSTDPVEPEDPEDPEDPSNPDEPNPWDANRGIVKRPQAGNGWTVTTIANGVVYYAFDGKEPITNVHQRIFVTDIDPAQGYAIKLGYYSKNNIASRIMASSDKIMAVINAGYEKTAIWIRVNGTNYGTIAYDRVGKANDAAVDASSDIPQWKSEAAVYMNQDQDVRIRFTGRNKTLQEWRTLYSYKCNTENNFITSSPMLISDYEPVGSFFCTLHPMKVNSSEDPYNHQASQTNPRTALATTENGHVLFIVVDGRRGTSVARGISADELTRFLVANFNPQYAINLDGGGSSAMCVRGQGDPESYVVNYPCDNRTEAKTISADGVSITWPKESNGPDHKGERARDTFIYAIQK